MESCGRLAIGLARPQFSASQTGGYIAARIPFMQGAYKTGPVSRTSPSMEKS
jgi:hypothetical protein